MRSTTEMELEVGVVRMTWCECEHCAAMGPRLITVVRNNREYVSNLRTQCCGIRKARERWEDEGVD